MTGVIKRGATELRWTATVLVFEPSSREFIDPAGAPPRLTRWREKFLALAALGVDRLVTLRVDESMRAMTPESFVKLIIDRMGARHIVVGNDFRYGCNAVGTIDSLRAAGEAGRFGVEQIAPFVFDGVRVSSTVVRERLGNSDFAGAARLLGRPYRMLGRVVHGRELGRPLGFPTANLRLMRRRPPVRGIMAVRVFGVEPRALIAGASLGARPTVDGTDMLLEVTLFDFSGSLD